jgi:hypothetical protein
MQVDLPLLKKTVLGLHSKMTIEEDVADNCLMYIVKYGDYLAYAALRIFESTIVTTGEVQAIGLSLTFTGIKGNVLDFSQKNQATSALLCNELQNQLDWGILSSCKMPNGTVEVALYRSFNTTVNDLKLAQSHDLQSELTTALSHLKHEFMHIAPVLQHYAATEDFNMDLVGKMLQPVGQTVFS